MDDDDFGDFGGFEAADPIEAQTVLPTVEGVTATPSPWAVFTAVEGGHTETPPVNVVSEISEETVSTPAPSADPTFNQDPPHDSAPIADNDKGSGDVTNTDLAAGARSEISTTIPLEETKVSDSDLEKMKAEVDYQKQLQEQLRNRMILTEEELATTSLAFKQQQEKYDQLQAVHEETVNKMREAGHDALTVIVNEYKELSKATLLQQKEESQKELISVMEEQNKLAQQAMEKQQEFFNSTLQTMRSDVEKQILDALQNQQDKFKNDVDKLLQEEQEKQNMAIEKAVEAEREASKIALEEASKSERLNSVELIEVEKKKFEEFQDSERKKSRTALIEAVESERTVCKETLGVALKEEQARAEKMVEETLLSARLEMKKYVEEQRQADARSRLRSLATLDLFTEGMKKQLDLMMTESKTSTQDLPGDEKPEGEEALSPKL